MTDGEIMTPVTKTTTYSSFAHASSPDGQPRAGPLVAGSSRRSCTRGRGASTSAQGPAPGRIGKRKGAGGVGAMNWELPERGSAHARCVLGWGVLTWARPLDSDSAKRSDASRVRWHRVGYRAPLGAHGGTLSTARGDDSKQPVLSARAGSLE